MTNEDRARSAASDWCRCSKCEGIANNLLKLGLRCDKYKLLTCRKFYDGYHAALIALNQLTNNNIMEYKKDVRTKNLTLRDIHVGDWVQVWSEITERYSPPLKIIQICDDGTIYLVTSDEERATPWEENIKNVDVLPFTFDILRGFGFEVVENDCHKDRYRVYYKEIYLFEIRKFDRGYGFSNSINYIRSFKEFIDNLGVFLPEILNIEWKGLDKQT